MKGNKDVRQQQCETPHLPDDEIVELYWSRNEKAITATDSKYGNYLHTIAYNIVHDRLDCEECVNDTYLGTWNRIPPTRPNIFQAFISRIMRNIAVDRYKKNTAAKRVPSELLVSLEELDRCMRTDPDLDDAVAVTHLSNALNSYLNGLSEREEFVFVCEATVFRALSNIRKGLKAHLEREGILHG